jgi:hypothetical protein
VIPEAWGLPPVLTIIGLGKRLARHLAAEQKPAVKVEEVPGPHRAVA